METRVRETVPDLLREFGYTAEAFAPAEEFLEEIPITFDERGVRR